MNEEILACKKCDLYKNQPPIIDRISHDAIMVVGLSAKKSNLRDMIPLDGRTRSGKLISDMESISRGYGFKLYRTNLVKCVPQDGVGKLRYPSQSEIDQCFNHVLAEIKEIQPVTIILLGKIVQSTFAKMWDADLGNINGIEFEPVFCNGHCLVPVYHPSYILRSKKRRDEYLKNYGGFVLRLSQYEKSIAM